MSELLQELYFQADWMLDTIDRVPVQNIRFGKWSWAPERMKPWYIKLVGRFTLTLKILKSLQLFYEQTSVQISNPELMENLQIVRGKVCTASAELEHLEEDVARPQTPTFMQQTRTDTRLLCTEIKHDEKAIEERQETIREQQKKVHAIIKSLNWAQEGFYLAMTSKRPKREIEKQEKGYKDALAKAKKKLIELELDMEKK
ncbi:hypothetical protein NW762_012888 [Fusarium torreyae]|uniref:Uncharacterized protein n=1 Tax=Fusarium torreyae TaxID=1237075 RepID=A0A9W8RLP8_9HYPO|nr:hypothetical protein NW762_012888 [Fusarium torreyae]